MLGYSNECSIFDSISEQLSKESAQDLSKAEVVNAINKQLAFIGLDFIKIGEENLKDKFTLVKKQKLDPKLTGPMGVIFKTIEVEVSVGYSEEYEVAGLHLNYNWQYESGGSNGNELRMRYEKGKWSIS